MANHSRPDLGLSDLRSAQTTTRCEYKSSSTARYAQPSAVQMYVMSPTQAWFGAAAVKLCASRLGATGSLWLESVVCRKRRHFEPWSQFSEFTDCAG